MCEKILQCVLFKFVYLNSILVNVFKLILKNAKKNILFRKSKVKLEIFET